MEITTDPSLPTQRYLDALVEELRPERRGVRGNYEPHLADVDDDLFAITLATVDGSVYASGDAEALFPLQSMSKPFTYALALARHGTEHVDRFIDVEPTGESFSSISLEPDTGRPRNPMVNAGAIMACSLIDGDGDDRIEAIRAFYGACAGRPLDVHEPTYASMAATADRNEAIGHMLRAAGVLGEHPDPVIELYLRQCAIAVDCRDVALMAATLANAGVHPVTQQEVLAPEHVRRVLSVMSTCGMYDAAGDWLVDVGLPAKSGVAGGIFAVLPGQLGIGVFSPRLDSFGNSIRGVLACERISTDLGLHSLEPARVTRASIRARFDLTMVPSTRRRPPTERARLAEVGQRCAIFQLQGDLVFAAMERITREAAALADHVDILILGLYRTSTLVEIVGTRLSELGALLAERGTELVLASTSDVARATGLRTFDSLDEALEWAEWRLLGVEQRQARPAVSLETHPITQQLSDAQRQRLAAACERRTFDAGDVLLRAADPADELLLLMAGETTVTSGERRLSTLLPGALVGRSSLDEDDPAWLVDLVAVRPGAVLALPVETFWGFADSDVELYAGLLRAMLTEANESVVRLSRQANAIT